jgi:hypothetical protein
MESFIADPKRLHALVLDISVPPNNALLGLPAILSMMFCTDNADAIINCLKIERASNPEKLLGTVIQVAQRLGSDPRRPIVWQFNDPNVDLKLLEASVRDTSTGSGTAFSDLVGFFHTHADTFPFIEVYDNELADAAEAGVCDVREFSNSGSKTSTPLRANEGRGSISAVGIESVMIPAFTIGSLMWLSKISKTEA